MPKPIREQYRIDAAGVFAGNFPNVPLAPGINLVELERGDEAPFFVTLPIVPEIDMVSKSGLLYDEALVGSIQQQIIDKRPGGNFGHMTGDESEVKFFHPAAYWVGAAVVDRTLWAKAYVPSGPAREHLRDLKSVGGRISTSIYGQGEIEEVKPGVTRLTMFDLENIDFAPPERASLQYAAPVHVTAEMVTSETMTETAEEDNMPTRDEIIAELRAGDLPENVRAQIISEYEANTGQQRRIVELETQVAEANTAKETAVAELQAEINVIRVAEFGRRVDARVAELTDWPVQGDANRVKLDALRKTFAVHIREMMGDSTDVAELEGAVNRAVRQLQPLAETMRDQMSGPAATVSGRVRQQSYRQIDDSPEARARARQRTGI